MKRRLAFAAAGISLLAVTASAVAMGNWLTVRAGEFDPLKTRLVQGAWVNGIGCPTNARTADFVGGEVVDGPSYTDGACTTGDRRDKHVRGLLLAKTGPTSNFASAVAQIGGVRGKTLTELGYDIRKPVEASDSRGSHCGAGAPRFNVVTTDGSLYFIGCNSPVADVAAVGNGWIRLRWSVASLVDLQGKIVESITIVFDEGQDTGPDNFGLAVLDNIDVNGRLVGTGGVSAGN